MMISGSQELLFVFCLIRNLLSMKVGFPVCRRQQFSRAVQGVNLALSGIQCFLAVSGMKFCADYESDWCHLRNVEHFLL